MMTFKQIREDNGFGIKYVTKYVCLENSRIEIVVERGSISHDRPTGFAVTLDGSTDYTSGIASFLTLAEAKAWAEQIESK